MLRQPSALPACVPRNGVCDGLHACTRMALHAGDQSQPPRQSRTCAIHCINSVVAGLQDRAEAKLAALEAAAEAARQEAAAHEKQWRQQQHERELTR